MTEKRADGWSRRNWLMAGAAYAVVPSANATTNSDPPHDRSQKTTGSAGSGSYYRDYSRVLPNYLSTLAREAYLKREHALSLLTTPAAIRKRQGWARETFWKLSGGQPERTPLEPRVVGQFERPGYTVEKVIYQSRPGIVVSANLYLPKAGKAPYPGVLFQMGHSGLGKAYAPYQKCCQGLAQLGFVVLAFDPMGQGERIAYPDATGTNTRLASVDEEHSLPGRQMLLLGDTASRFQVWDAMRSLDYLASHPSVDPERLASTGQSGGGTLTMLLACVDDRLSAAAVCSGNTENLACATFNPPGSTDDAEQDLINGGVAGFDRWDLLCPIAPKPLLIQISEHDFFGTYSPQYLEDSRAGFDNLSRIYGVLGHADRLGWRSSPLPHSLNYEFRLSIYTWFTRWLNKSDRPIEQEPPVRLEEEKTLWTGATGNVYRDYKSERPFDLIRKNAAAVRRGTRRMEWTKSLPISPQTRHSELRQLSLASLSGAQVAAVEVNSDGEVWIPAWLFVPDTPDHRRATVIVLDDRGRNTEVHEDDLYHRLARSGTTVLAADVRGMGDTRPEAGRGNPGYTLAHDSEDDYAWASLILGNPLLAQRVTDILALTQALKSDNRGSGRLALAARGSLTIPSLFAFAASRDIASLYLAEGLVSYQRLLETEIYRQTLATFAWDVFRYADLPSLAAEAAPRLIRLAGAVDAAGETVTAKEMRRLYTSENVSFLETARWDEEVFVSL